jgi:hypothetical protein
VRQVWKRPEYDYIGVKECGCVVAICHDLGDKETAKEVAELIRSGLHVERVPVAEAVRRFGRCTHGKPMPEQATQPPLLEQVI